MLINYQDSRPIYEQIVDRYRHLILMGALAPEEQMLWMELMVLLAELFARLNPLEMALLTPLASREAAPTTAPVPEVIADAKPLVRACPPAFPTGSM